MWFKEFSGEPGNTQNAGVEIFKDLPCGTWIYMLVMWFKSDSKLAAEPRNIFQQTHHRFYNASSPA